MSAITAISGRSIIGFREGSGIQGALYAKNPATGHRLEPGFFPATVQEVELAVQLASKAFSTYGHLPGSAKAAFLRKIATKIESISAELTERAQLETALPPARLQGETARTCGQLRLFANLIQEGSWVMARIDHADSGRKPLPKPDVRSMLHPLGPVVVFAPSNFPLAFSVAGGDTASALAAGNPVIVKGHSAHPGTSELVGRVVQEAVRESGLPEGVFSLLFGSGAQVGTALMQHPLVKAGGFTGSRAAGRALMDVAAARPEPIPFFAEMSSTNPVFILPGALHQRGEEIASGLYTSFTMGAGQFCTKPGLVFFPAGHDAIGFKEKLRQLVNDSAPFHLLTPTIHSSYGSSISDRKKHKAIQVLAESTECQGSDAFSAISALFESDAESFLASDLAEEIFGPTTLLVHHSSREQVMEIANSLEGHLTATIHGTEEDLNEFADLISILRHKVGRLVFNGFPTGVEVCHAMVHGGPYPATSDSRFTSVGTQAILRFARPVCYQGFPQSALPEELQDANPVGIWRMVDGQMTRDACKLSR